MDSVEGRPKVPSFYALDLLRAAEGRLPDLKQLERRAATAAHTRLGWPAPEDPRRAIDVAEHDLATLAPLLLRPPDEVRGRARHLVDANPALARSLRARFARWSVKRWTTSDGLIDPDPKGRALLAPYRLRARPHAPTALESFSACPYKFALQDILRLRPRQEPLQVELMDPRTRGKLFHQVQLELHRELAGLGLLPMRVEHLAELRARAIAVLERIGTEYEELLAPAIPPVWKRSVEELKGDLLGFIRNAIDHDGEWLPIHWELAFGLPKGSEERDPASSSEPVVVLDGIILRGAIDVVERHLVSGGLRVSDYKTGRPPFQPPRMVAGGEHFQPLLYALVAERLLQAPVERGSLLYGTQRGGYRRHDVRFDAEGKQAISRALSIIDRALEEGFLPAAPRKMACSFCDYSSVCGPHEESRTQRKEPEPVRSLRVLREMP
jgi:CRISPR/Cas system-associated exonuclease Cas4 (RecB family)